MIAMPGPSREHQGAPLLAVLFLIGLGLLLAWQKTATVDLHFHLAIGREIVARHSTLPVDVFSYSVPGAPWPYKDVVADVLLYLGFHHFGFPFFFALKLLAALSIGGVLLLGARESDVPGGKSVPWLLSLGLLLAAVQYRVVERPLLLSLVLFPLLLVLLERARRGLHRARPFALFAPPVLLHWGWIQVHREALIGLVFLGGFCGYLLLSVLLARVRPGICRVAASRRAIAASLLALIVAAGLTLLNPCGVATVTSTFTVSGSRLYRQVFMDWRALGPAELFREFPVAVVLSLGALLGLCFCVGRDLFRRPAAESEPGVDLWHLGCFLVLLAKTLESSRYVPFLASQSALIVVLLLQDGMEWLARRGRPPRGLLVLAGALSLVLVATTLPASTARGIGPLLDHYPEQALRFAHEHRLHEKVANALSLGGYVMWEGRAPDRAPLKVVLDGRADMIYPAEHLRECLIAERRSKAFTAMRQRDGADWVLAGNEVGLESHPFLSRDPAWGLVFWSEAAVIFVRRDAYPELSGLLFRHFDRADPFGSVARAAARARRDPAQLPQIEAEMRRLLAGSPTGALSHTLLVLFYHHLGHLPERDRLRDELRRLHPDHPVLERLPG